MYAACRYWLLFFSFSMAMSPTFTSKCCLVLIPPLLYCTTWPDLIRTYVLWRQCPPFVLHVLSVLPTFGYYDLYHVFRLSVCACVYKLALVIVPFLIAMSPACCYFKIYFNSFVTECFFSLELIGCSDVFCMLCCSVFAVDLYTHFPWRNHNQKRCKTTKPVSRYRRPTNDAIVSVVTSSNQLLFETA
jgi:hypothetical protein